MLLSTPKVLRVPTVKSVLVPRTVRRKTNIVPSGRAVAARTGRTVKRATR